MRPHPSALHFPMLAFVYEGECKITYLSSNRCVLDDKFLLAKNFCFKKLLYMKTLYYFAL